MNVVLYILIGVVTLVGAWWALKVSLGLWLPLENVAYAYFSQLLKKMGLSEVVPPSCVAECVADSIQFARLHAKIFGNKKRVVRAETVQQLELHADQLRFWIRGSDAFDALGKNRFKEMFERHRVPRLAEYVKNDT